jgi:hypothetical protein
MFLFLSFGSILKSALRFLLLIIYIINYRKKLSLFIKPFFDFFSLVLSFLSLVLSFLSLVLSQMFSFVKRILLNLPNILILSVW